jgi:thiol-disulfide isomerase/thioredoxin
MRSLRVVAAIAILATGCGTTIDGPLPDPPSPTTTDEVLALIDTGAPAVVNVWASWCLPCRSEAPLIASASAGSPTVTFIALDVRDDPADAQRFIAEHLDDAGLIFLSDPSGSIPIDLGGTRGVPTTFFYGSDGALVHTHFGAIDEPTMARYLDEIGR